VAITTESGLEEGETEVVSGAKSGMSGRRKAIVGVIAAVLVIAVAAAIGFLVWAAHYQPLVVGTSATSTSQVVSMPGSVMSRYDYLVAETGAKYIVDTPKPGQTFDFIESVMNSGRSGVTIVSAGTPGAGPTSIGHALLHESVYAIAGDNRGAGFNFSTRGVPIKSYDLGHDYQVGIHVVEKIPTCATRPNQTAKDALPAMDIMPLDHYQVTYRFLWFTHTITFPIREPIAIINIPSCP
jgi:hypothetical protein